MKMVTLTLNLEEMSRQNRAVSKTINSYAVHRLEFLLTQRCGDRICFHHKVWRRKGRYCAGSGWARDQDQLSPFPGTQSNKKLPFLTPDDRGRETQFSKRWTRRNCGRWTVSRTMATVNVTDGRQIQRQWQEWLTTRSDMGTPTMELQRITGSIHKAWILWKLY
jgi:hypothetical protein